MCAVSVPATSQAVPSSLRAAEIAIAMSNGSHSIAMSETFFDGIPCVPNLSPVTHNPTNDRGFSLIGKTFEMRRSACTVSDGPVIVGPRMATGS